MNFTPGASPARRSLAVLGLFVLVLDPWSRLTRNGTPVEGGDAPAAGAKEAKEAGAQGPPTQGPRRRKAPALVPAHVPASGGRLGGRLVVFEAAAYAGLINGLANLSFSELHLNITARMWQQVPRARSK